MAVAKSLVLVANPGSASRKYAVFSGGVECLSLHFELHDGRVICTVGTQGSRCHVALTINDLEQAVHELPAMLKEYMPSNCESVEAIGLRVVAPSGYFLHDHVLHPHIIEKLEALHERSPLHISATLQEYKALKKIFPQATIVGVSDSAFHITKPDHAWNYGLPLHDADKYEIKRFGYHGLSVASVVRQLQALHKLPPKLIVCHLGSGASVTAVLHGKSADTTMGYSPLEGLTMATRSGSIDLTAALVLKKQLKLSDQQLESYRHHEAGLLGLSGVSSDVRELLAAEANGHHTAKLALDTYIYTVQKAIGQMSAVLGGVDVLVFTGTVGERSAVIRERVVKALQYLDFELDGKANKSVVEGETVCVSHLAHSKPIFVVPADEADEIATQVERVISS